MTYQEFIQSVITDLQNGSADIQTDNQGQYIVYTNLFKQTDESVEEHPDPEWEDE